MNFFVESWHSDNPEAPEIVEEVATSERNEASFGGGILLLTLEDGAPVVAVAVGEDTVNPALNEVRKVVAGDAITTLTDEDRYKGLSLLAREIVRRSELLANGLVYRPNEKKTTGVSPDEFANAFPKRDINGVVIVQAAGFSELVSSY